MATCEEERHFNDVKSLGAGILLILALMQPLFWAVLSPDPFHPNYIGTAINIIIDIIIIAFVISFTRDAAKEYHMD